MSLGSVVLLIVIWSVVFDVLTSESLRYNGIHRNRHKYKRRELFSGENKKGYARFHKDESPLLLLDEDEGDASADATFELDKPLPIEQVAVPVGGKAYLPCDTRSSSQDRHGKSTEPSGFFMVMWFREHNDNDPVDESYDQPATTLSTSGEPIFTYDMRQTSAKFPNPPRPWSSQTGFGDRAYFHTSNRQLQHDQDLVDHLTVDRAMATDTGVYRCRIDFLKAPTRNRLVNLTVIVAPDRPKIYIDRGNGIGEGAADTDRPENYQQDSGNVIVVDEGSPAVTLVCSVNGGWPRPRLTWYHENTVLDSTHNLVTDEYRKKNSSRPAAVTVNRLQLTNLTRWHPIMSQRHRTMGTARLTCQASNSIATSTSGGFSRPSVIAANGNLPPPATTEHTFIRLNLKPTEVQIVSMRDNGNDVKIDESRTFDTEVTASEDKAGQKKYTIRADRTYRAECLSKGSRPLATTEWYLLKKNQRYNIGQSTANGTSGGPGASFPVILSAEKLGGTATILEGAISGIMETQQKPSMVTDKDEMIVTTSILNFMLRGPKSAAAVDENDDGELTLVCRAYNSAIKTSDRHYVETKVTLDVQYPPVVELRFGNRMLDTGRIGPGDDVYFDCVARANPSTTIRYSWYHNGVQLTQDAEKKRIDVGDKRGEKRNSTLASRVIQYSQSGSLVLQSVKTTAAGKYACHATNGIENESIENKTMSNTVRLFVKHVPVCQHREEIMIVTKKSDADAGPVIRCRTGRGHPPATEFHWTFYPEQPEPDIRDGNTVDTAEMSLAGRPARGLDALLAETAVQGGGGDGGASYTFTTSTPVLKSYSSAVAAAVSASPNAVRPNLLYGRLECQAVNTMGMQLRPCVYRITDKTTASQRNKGLQEITDCRTISRDEPSNDATNATVTYPCVSTVDDFVTGTNRRTRFCIACTFNTSSAHYHQQRLNYVLQLYKSTRGETPDTGVIAFNVTGVAITEDTGNTRNNYKGQDDSDYYFDPDEDEIVGADRGDYNHDGKNVVQRVVFVIDDSVEPGMYRGKVYNSDGGIISAVVRGMINVAAVAFDDNDENDSSSNYIIDDVEDETTDESMLGSAWRHVTIALVEMFSMVVPPSPRQDSDKAHRRQQMHKHWQAASVVLTAILIAVVIALSCGICGVVAILYRRQYYNHRTDRGHVYGLNCNDGEDDDDADISEGKIIIGQQKMEVVQPVVGVGGQRQQQQTPLPTRSSRRAEYSLEGAVSGNAEVSAPLLQLQRPVVQRLSRVEESRGQLPSEFLSATMRRHSGIDTADAIVTVKNTTAANRDNDTGPDIVMSTAATSTPANADRSCGNWQQKHQSQQMKYNTMNSNHQRSLYRLEYQKPNTTIPHTRTTLTTTITPVASVVITNKHTNPKTIKTIIDEPLSVPSQVLLSALHRESSI